MKVLGLPRLSKACHLSVDKRGWPISVGDILESSSIPVLGSSEVKERYSPVELYRGKLAVRQNGSFLHRSFVESKCVIVGRQLKDVNFKKSK